MKNINDLNYYKIINLLLTIRDKTDERFIEYGIHKEDIEELIERIKVAVLSHPDKNFEYRGASIIANRREAFDLIMHSLNIIKLHYKLSFLKGSVQYKSGATANFYGLSEMRFEEKYLQFYSYTLQILPSFKNIDVVTAEMETMKANFERYKELLGQFKQLKSGRLVAVKERTRLRVEIYNEVGNVLRVAKFIYKDTPFYRDYLLTKILYPKNRRGRKAASEQVETIVPVVEIETPTKIGGE